MSLVFNFAVAVAVKARTAVERLAIHHCRRLDAFCWFAAVSLGLKTILHLTAAWKPPSGLRFHPDGPFN